MAVVTYPGVYMQEVSSGVRPIAAASTSTAAFIGQAERGEIGKAVRIFNFTEYQNEYGGFLNTSFLSHAVYQYFNNGGSQCYVVRVAGSGTETAAVELKDRSETVLDRDPSLKISAKSPGQWGNHLAVTVGDGSSDPGNEFDLTVYREEGEKLVRLEGFEGLSMAPESPRNVGTVMAGSSYVDVTVLPNTNTDVGYSVSAGTPSVPLTGKTWLRINIDEDGYQNVDLLSTATTPDLATPAGVAAAITEVVADLTPLRGSTAAAAFDDFTCTVEDGKLVLKSGVASETASVRIGRMSDASLDASAQLSLGVSRGGVESLGIAVRKPVNTATDAHYLVGDNAADTDEVGAVTLGSDGQPVDTDTPYIDALSALDGVQDVSLVAIPGIGSPEVVGAGMAYCEGRNLSDCFFIGDASQVEDNVADAQAFQVEVNPKNSFGAVYMPWVQTLDPTGKSSEPILVPPSGFVAGIFARTDAQRGVWKAPAGSEATLNGAVGLAAELTDTEQGVLNPLNVNVLRRFNASGIVAWGARTLASDAEWKYVPVRRMANMLRVSIYNGIQWAVFEPNDAPLWRQLRLNVDSFMNGLFRQGAFQGSSPSDAYFVKCDSETTTQGDIDQGIVNLLVGFAPLKPAEFIVVKISQKAGPA